eukprot:2296687-Pyramimonas_sp.AAC.1
MASPASCPTSPRGAWGLRGLAQCPGGAKPMSRGPRRQCLSMRRGGRRLVCRAGTAASSSMRCSLRCSR